MAVAESLCFGVVVFSLIKFWQYWSWRKKVNKMLENMDGPKGLPLLGVALELFSVDNILGYISKKSAEYSSPAKVWFGPTYLVIHVDDPKSAKTILLAEETLDKAEFYKFVRLDNTILANKKHIWRSQRKALNTMRNKNKISAYNPQITKRVLRMIESMSRHVDGSEFDVFNYIGAYIIEAVFEVAFDTDYTALDNPEENELINKIEMSNETYMKRMSTVWYHIEAIYRCSKLYKEELKYKLESFYGKLMDRKLEDWKKIVIDDNDSKDLGIAVFIKPENNFKDEEIRDSLKGLVFAAFDTTSSVLSSALLLLGIHQNVQDKLYKEIVESFGSTNREIDFESIAKLKYLNLVCKETVRLFPAIPVIGRYATEDLELGDGITIPAGTNILINLMSMHRNPKYWGEDAHLFIPERFEPDRIKNVDLNAYIPFSLGQRNCIGYTYAQLFLKTALVHVVKNYHISSNVKFDDIKYDVKLTLKVLNGYKISIKKR